MIENPLWRHITATVLLLHIAAFSDFHNTPIINTIRALVKLSGYSVQNVCI